MSIGAGWPEFEHLVDDVCGLEEELQLRKKTRQFPSQISNMPRSGGVFLIEGD